MYEIAKDFLLPLMGFTAAIIVPFLTFVILPRARDRRRTALDLFTAYTTDDMRQTRNEVWAYFVFEVADNPQERNQRFDQYLDYLTEKERWSTIPSREAMAVFQKASRVLDSFAFVEACLRNRLANACLVRFFLGRFYLWWRDELMLPLRQRRRIDTSNPLFVPLWWRPLVNLDRLAGAAAQPSVAAEPPLPPRLAAPPSLPGVAPTTKMFVRSDAICG